jgi:outer membrane lipoprotein carrier protein
VIPILCVLLWIALPVRADTALGQLLDKLQKKYDSMETLRASFTQSYHSKRFSEKITESGVVYLRKGGLMKWQYLKPEKKVFVSDGNYFYYYVVEDKQVVKARMAQNPDQLSPALFLAGRGNFIQDFRAEWADPRPGSHLLKLTPLRPQPDFKYLLLDVDPVSGLILRMDVIDAYENRTEYLFQQIQENLEIPSDFFTFRPPPGTDVIYQQSEETD